jgi:predicted P-loop ATPase
MANGSNGAGHISGGVGSNGGGLHPGAIPPHPGTTPPPPHPSVRKVSYVDSKSIGACNVRNVITALRQEPAVMNLFAYDEMQCTEMLMRSLDGDPNFKPRPKTDIDATRVQSHLQTFGFRRLGRNTMHEAISVVAREHSYHPVRNYLDGCATEWDRQHRVCTWLCDYAGAELSEYTTEVGIMFLVGMVARIYKPGCKNDYQLIAEGPQGWEKSTMFETLVGEEYFSDHLPDLASKDASQHMKGKWLIEMAEMHAYTRAEITKYKEFMARKIEKYRPAYGRGDVREPRTCVFAGTTNRMQYLRDATGNRRSWPVAFSTIEIGKLKQDLDQLWGEAVHLYRNDIHWWPTHEFEHKHIRPEQEARFEPDPWEPLIKEELDKLIRWALHRTPSDIPRTTIIEIAENVLGFTREHKQDIGELKTPIVRLDPKTGQRIAAVLHHLGWVPKHNKHGERWWEPGPEAMQT